MVGSAASGIEVSGLHFAYDGQPPLFGEVQPRDISELSLSPYRCQWIRRRERMDLLEFFREECEQRGATVVYATHIFDGLETWATDVAYIQDGGLRRCGKMTDFHELKSANNLLSVVESWLHSEYKLPKKEPINNHIQSSRASPFDASPFRSSRHMAYYR